MFVNSRGDQRGDKEDNIILKMLSKSFFKQKSHLALRPEKGGRRKGSDFVSHRDFC